MAASTSDKVGWVAGVVLAIAAVIFVLWPSLKKLGKSSSAKGQNDNGAGPAIGGVPADPIVNAAGVQQAGSPNDQLGAPRQAVGAVGLANNAGNQPAQFVRLQKLQTIII